jgi:crotonobetainyl-CoA:carnitine CoA-transferase CaiB-like acyl-CoA transferase
LAHLGGLDPLAQAACGIEWEAGPVASGNPPLWYRYGHGDVAAAMPSVLALLIALFHRTRTGEGQSMWASLFHGAQLYTADSWLGPDGIPSPRPTLDAAQMGIGALYRLYQTTDGWLQLAAVKEEHWRALCAAVGQAELAEDRRFATPAGRDEHRDELTDLLASVFASDLAVNWRRVLDAAGVPCDVSVDTWDGETILFDRELEKVGLIAEYEHPFLGVVRQAGNFFTFSDTPGKQERAAPMVGQHTREIMTELGYADGAIDAYAEAGIVSWPGEDYHWPV